MIPLFLIQRLVRRGAMSNRVQSIGDTFMAPRTGPFDEPKVLYRLNYFSGEKKIGTIATWGTQYVRKLRVIEDEKYIIIDYKKIHFSFVKDEV